MGKIHVLDKNISNKIAAGEVVSRPASAVKELIENSLDAGAKNIEIETKNGGITYIRVTDNGSGIEEDDILVAFMPHATSKIETENDLSGILTYGFRGEALASISSVSKVTLITKTADAESGIKIKMEGGELGESEIAPAKVGTTIIVEDLFYNTPARFKFLKKDSAESAAITDVCQKAALSRPDVSFRYIASGKEMFYTVGDGDLLNAIYSIFGKDFAKHMIKVDTEKGGARVTGYIGTAAVARPNRNMQIFYVNGRNVVSKTMSFALSEGFKNQLTVGKFPSAVLNITIEPEKVDVNVHPSKIEVKFTDEKPIYDAIYWGCHDALYEKPYVPSVESTEKVTQSVKIAPTFEKKEEVIVEKLTPPTVEPKEQFNFKEIKFEEIYKPIEKKEVAPVLAASEQKSIYEVAPIDIQEEIVMEEVTDIKLIGQIFDSYIIAQKGKEMLIIDQHAAHERLNFEDLKKKKAENNASSQMLLIPEIVSLSATEFCVWQDNQEFFSSIGFETEVMGETDVMIRSVPKGTEEANHSDVLIEMIDILKDKRQEKRTYLEERAMYSVSCKAAIKANMAISEKEQIALVEKVLALKGINTCPHGRPILITMSKEKIEKEFKRI